jgi:AcrR family transcriptional regulator
MMSSAQDRSRPYRSELRERQAAQTRHRVVEAAVRLFSRQGYSATTFAQIAAEAGVSVETVQKHGPKTALLQSAGELASFGVDAPADIFDTEIGRAILRVQDGEEFAEVIAESMLVVNPPSAGIWRTVVGAAQGDADLARYQAELLSSIRVQVAKVLGHADEQGWLRRDVPFDDLVETMCIITSVDAYIRFVEFDGGSTDAYKAFVIRMLRETVLTP